MSLLTNDEIKYLKENKNEITDEILSLLRKQGSPGKKQALEILDLPKDNDNYYLDAYNNRISYNGIRTLKSAYTKLKLSQIHIKELEKCKNDIHYFLSNYVRMTTPWGFDFVETRDYQNEFLDVLCSKNENIICTLARQSSKSTTTSVYLSHLFLFREDLTMGIIAYNGNMAREFLDKTKKVLGGLPIWIQNGIVTWNKGSIEGENNSRVLTDSPGPESFRGYSCVHEDSLVDVKNKISGKISKLTLKELYNLDYLNYKIKTPNGFESYKDIILSIQNTGLKITFDNTSISVTHDHKFIRNSGIILARDLRIGMFLQGHKIIDIIPTEGKFYDFLEVENHIYYANDILNHNCNIIVVDECAYLNPEGFFAISESLFPSQAGLSFKKLIMLSTPNGKNHFYDIWKDSAPNLKDSKNGFVNFTVDWRKIPRYKSDGTKYDPEDFKRETIKKSGPVLWNSAYECNFIGSAQTLIPGEILNSFKTQEPLEIDKFGNSLIKIYENPIQNHKYVMGVDTAKDGLDYSGIQIFDMTDLNFKQVLSAKLKIDYVMLPEIINEYGLKFNSALVIVENNEGSGQVVADTLKKDFEYENLYYDYKSHSKERQRYPGFRTTKMSREIMLQTVKMLAENNKLSLVDSDTIKEFETFTANEKGKYQAAFGYHDDLVMSCCLCFGIFNNIKNFEDFREVIDSIKTGNSIGTDYLTFGAFGDGLGTSDDADLSGMFYN